MFVLLNSLKCVQNLSIKEALSHTTWHCSPLRKLYSFKSWLSILVSAVVALYLLDIASILKSVVLHSTTFRHLTKKLCVVFPLNLFKALFEKCCNSLCDHTGSLLTFKSPRIHGHYCRLFAVNNSEDKINLNTELYIERYIEIYRSICLYTTSEFENVYSYWSPPVRWHHDWACYQLHTASLSRSSVWEIESVL